MSNCGPVGIMQWPNPGIGQTITIVLQLAQGTILGLVIRSKVWYCLPGEKMA